MNRRDLVPLIVLYDLRARTGIVVAIRIWQIHSCRVVHKTTVMAVLNVSTFMITLVKPASSWLPVVV